MTAIEEIRSCQEQIRKKTDELKTDLARQLDNACRILAVLHELGLKNVLSEPQYYEFLAQLTPGGEELPKKTAPRRARGDIVEALRMVVEDAKTPLSERDLRKEVEKLMGRRVSALYQHLSKMCKNGFAVKTGSRYALAAKPPTNGQRSLGSLPGPSLIAVGPGQ